MNRLQLATFVVVAVFGLISGPSPVHGAKPFARASTQTVDLGRRIFEHNWARPESWAGPEKLGKKGDGLGPMFNDVSCVACHEQGGGGGAGENSHNVELLNVDLRSSPLIRARMQMLEQAHTVHPTLSRTKSSMVLHHFGFGSGDEELEYQKFRFQLREQVLEGTTKKADPTVVQARFEVAERNTPALWGLGEIEQIRIRQGNRLRVMLAVWQRQNGRGVSGRLPRTVASEQGWYGWRGQVGDLQQFVESACATELGLDVPQQVQPENPLHPSASRNRSGELDLTRQQILALTAFVAKLPRPVQFVPSDPVTRQIAEDGEVQFHRIGCAECHVRTMGTVAGIYSDFLLHDMGPRTADQATANPERMLSQAEVERLLLQADYYGGDDVTSQSVPTQLDQEWRTPPLWGAADSAPYLHDGRAETFHDAIEMHEGEASQSAEAYRLLNDEQRGQLLSFLDTLRAPLLDGDK